MIVLPDEDEAPVGVQVNAAIGEALRQSVAGAELSPGFEARLAAALDVEAPGGQPSAPAPAADGQALPGAAGQDSEAVQAAS